MSARVLREARAQQAEVEAEERGMGGVQRLSAQVAPPAADSSSDDDDGGYASEGGASDAPWPTGEVAVSPEDEAALAAFARPEGSAPTRTLADVILARLAARQAAAQQEGGEDDEGAAAAGPSDDDRLEAVYRGVGRVLSRYTAGALPKAFKVVPSLRDWEDVLGLMDPSLWTPHATFQATRLFVSSLPPKPAQRFVCLVLLPAVRADIRANRRLHFALYQAVKKAAYKPDAFFKVNKGRRGGGEARVRTVTTTDNTLTIPLPSLSLLSQGLLIPLCQAGDCSLREAVILSSALARVSLPALHSAAALLRLAALPYAGTTSFFMRVLLDKKYALPYRVVDGLVDHFAAFTKDQRQLPVVWHQCLLTFVQRYGGDVRPEDRAALATLCKAQYHHAVTPEVTRALAAAPARGAAKAAAAAGPATPALLKGKAGGEDPRRLPAVVLMEED
jgi:essential nuclear protein 1